MNASDITQDQAMTGSPRLLVASIVTAVAASICCLGPFLLLATGFSAAWMSQLMAIEPYQPLLVGISLALVLRAGWLLIMQPSCSSDLRASVMAFAGKRQALVYFVVLCFVLILITSEYWIVWVAS